MCYSLENREHSLLFFFNEFLMTTTVDVDSLIEACVNQGILPGVKVGDGEILIAVTEMNTREQMERLVEIVETL